MVANEFEQKAERVTGHNASGKAVIKTDEQIAAVPRIGAGIELAIWRDTLVESLGPNARLMTDLIPELKLIIDDPPPVPELDPQQAQGRFQLVRRFIGVFAQQEHPHWRSFSTICNGSEVGNDA